MASPDPTYGELQVTALLKTESPAHKHKVSDAPILRFRYGCRCSASVQTYVKAAGLRLQLASISIAGEGV